ncbi:hypothetical protein U1Q18_012579 [Sarracenia purpurea var. burkii]
MAEKSMRNQRGMPPNSAMNMATRNINRGKLRAMKFVDDGAKKIKRTLQRYQLHIICGAIFFLITVYLIKFGPKFIDILKFFGPLFASMSLVGFIALLSYKDAQREAQTPGPRLGQDILNTPSSCHCQSSTKLIPTTPTITMTKDAQREAQTPRPILDQDILDTLSSSHGESSTKLNPAKATITRTKDAQREAQTPRPKLGQDISDTLSSSHGITRTKDVQQEAQTPGPKLGQDILNTPSSSHGESSTTVTITKTRKRGLSRRLRKLFLGF